MGKKHLNENHVYKSYFSDLKRELSGVKLPAMVLTFTLIVAVALPYLGEKIAELTSLYSIQDPPHECTFINFDQTEKRQRIEEIVAQNIKSFSLISGAEQLGTSILEEIPDITSIRCSLDRDHTVRLVITGNNTVSHGKTSGEQHKDSKSMQVLQHQPPYHAAKTIPQENPNGNQLTATFADSYDLLLSTTDALFSKTQQLPNTFHAKVQLSNSGELPSINIATNDSTAQKTILSHAEPSLSYKGNQL